MPEPLPPCPHRTGADDAPACGLVRLRLPDDLSPVVHPSVCRWCVPNVPTPTPDDPGKAVLDSVRIIHIRAGRTPPDDGRRNPPPRPPCVHLGAMVRAGDGCPLCDVHDCTLLGMDVTRKDDCAKCEHHYPKKG